MTDVLGHFTYYVAQEDRPVDHGERLCHMGERCRTFIMDGVVGKLSRYTAHLDGRDVHLCPLCENDRVRRFLEPHEYLEFGHKGRRS